MTKIERAELETDLEEIQTAIDEYSVALIGLTDKHRAANILLDALTFAAYNAGVIRYKLKQAEEENDE